MTTSDYAAVVEVDGVRFEVRAEVSDQGHHPDELELTELVGMAAARLASQNRRAVEDRQRRDAEAVDSGTFADAVNGVQPDPPTTTCPAVYAGRYSDDGTIVGLSCTLEVGHEDSAGDRHHRAGTGVAWVSTIDPWAAPRHEPWCPNPSGHDGDCCVPF